MPYGLTVQTDPKPRLTLLLGLALAAAAALLLWEGRDLTFFVDEWSFGYGDRTGWGLDELLAPENGHLALVPVLLTKLSLELFGAATALPLRIVAVALHLTVAVLLYTLLRPRLGALLALAPTLLVLFLGSAGDLLVGSHGIPMLLAVASGLGAWIVLARATPGGDLAAALLLTLGLLSNGLALLFLAGAIAIVLLGSEPGRARRLWTVAAPLTLYLAWRLAYGDSGESGFAFANLAAAPGFAFESLGAELAALTGLFTTPGARAQSFDPGPGLALAGALLVALAALWLSGRWRPPRSLWPFLAALLALWLLTAAVASPLRQPVSARYLYPGVILLLLLAAETLSASPWRRRAGLLLAGVCLVALLPNLREINYSGDFFREQSTQDRAVLAAADTLGPEVPATLVLEPEGDPAAVGVADLDFDLAAYRQARERYGTPAYSPADLTAAPPSAQAAAAHLLQRAAGE